MTQEQFEKAAELQEKLQKARQELAEIEKIVFNGQEKVFVNIACHPNVWQGYLSLDFCQNWIYSLKEKYKERVTEMERQFGAL